MAYNSFAFANDVYDSLIGNLKTLTVGNQSLNLWTDATAALTKGWSTHNPNDLSDGDPKTPPKGVSDQIAGINSTDDVQTFIDNYLNADHLDEFTSKDISALLGQLAKHYDSTSGSVQMSEITQFGNLVSAQSTIETSTGNTESKSEASFVQQSTSAPQSISDIGNSAIGILGTVSSVLMQSFL